MPKTGQRNRNSRIDALLDAAASHFATRGYRETTIRDITKSIDMLPGSVYYHFPSKHDLLLEVYKEGVRRLEEHVNARLSRSKADPWSMLEALVTAHLEAILDQSDYASVIVTVRPTQVPEIADKLAQLREDYEKLVRERIRNLPLPRNIDRDLLRLMLIGAANWTHGWYRSGKKSPAEIGKQFVTILRLPLEK